MFRYDPNFFPRFYHLVDLVLQRRIRIGVAGEHDLERHDLPTRKKVLPTADDFR